MSTTITDRGILITAREAAFLADAISRTARPVPRVRMPSSFFRRGMRPRRRFTRAG